MVSQPKKLASPVKIDSNSLLILDLCFEIHKLAEEIYLDLAEAHGEFREFARMWGLFAIDKCNHADTYKMACRLKGDGILKIHGTDEFVRGILSKMKKIPKVNKNKPPSIENALRFSIKMEEFLSNVHFLYIVQFVNEQDAALLSSQLKSSSNILHVLTEEYVNLTLSQSETF